MRLRNEVLFGYKRTKLEVHNAGRLATHLFRATGGTSQIFRFHFLFFWGGGGRVARKRLVTQQSVFSILKSTLFLLLC